MPSIIQSQGLRTLADIRAYANLQNAIGALDTADITPTIGAIVEVENLNAVDVPYIWHPPRMREWIGERQLSTMQGGRVRIDVRTFEASVAIPRSLLEDEMLTVLEGRIRQLGNEYVRFLHEQTINVLLNGQTLNSFDALPLLSAARGTTNTNLLTAPLSMTSLQDAISSMMSFEEPDTGRVLGIEPTHLLVGPRLRWTATQLLESQAVVIAGNTDRTVANSNPLQGVVQLLVSPYIRANQWFLIAAGANEARPVLRVDRIDVRAEFSARTTPDSDSYFYRDSLEYGLRARHGWGPGAWFSVIGSFPT